METGFTLRLQKKIPPGEREDHFFKPAGQHDLTGLYFKCETYGCLLYGAPTRSEANSSGESSYNDLRVDALMNPLNLPLM